jgi:PilZ domain
MAYTRQHPRITQTEDLSATLRPAGRTCVVGRVLNLSIGGMLVASSVLELDETARFELAGSDFSFAGVAQVAHRSDQATGLHFVSWQGPANRPVRTLVTSRLRGQLGSGEVGGRDRLLRRVVVFVGIEREPGRGRQPST